MKYKIAICLSGEPRLWKQCKPYYEKFPEVFSDNSGKQDVDIDYFIHSYDEVTHRSSRIIDTETVENVHNNRYITPDFTPILDFYKPKRHLIETKDALLPYIQYFFKEDEDEYKKIKYSNYSRLSQWMSTSKSIRLCVDFARETNTKYDFVIKSRFDVQFFNHPQINIRQIVHKLSIRDWLIIPRIWCKNGRTNIEYGIMWGSLALMEKAWVEDFPYRLHTLQANVKSFKEWEYRNDIIRKTHRATTCHSILHYYWAQYKKIQIMCGWPTITFPYKILRVPTLPEMVNEKGKKTTGL